MCPKLNIENDDVVRDVKFLATRFYFVYVFSFMTEVVGGENYETFLLLEHEKVFTISCTFYDIRASLKVSFCFLSSVRKMPIHMERKIYNYAHMTFGFGWAAMATKELLMGFEHNMLYHGAISQ